MSLSMHPKASRSAVSMAIQRSGSGAEHGAASSPRGGRLVAPVPLRVLVGQQDRERRGAIAAALRQAGYEVLPAKNGCELLELLDAAQSEDGDLAPFDAVIVDVSLPGQSRYGLVLQIRRLDPDLPVIVMNSHDGSPQSDAFGDGADAVLDRHLDVDALRTVLRILVGPAAS